VVAVSAQEMILVGATIDEVVAIVTVKQVLISAAKDQIVPRASVTPIVASAPLFRGDAPPSRNPVVAGAAGNRGSAGEGSGDIDSVVAASAVDRNGGEVGQKERGGLLVERRGFIRAIGTDHDAVAFACADDGEHAANDFDWITNVRIATSEFVHACQQAAIFERFKQRTTREGT